MKRADVAQFGRRTSPRSLSLEVRSLSSAPKFFCRGGATGRRADLKHQLLRVQISPPVPNIYVVANSVACVSQKRLSSLLRGERLWRNRQTHWSQTPVVEGSTPSSRTKFCGCSSIGLERELARFEAVGSSPIIHTRCLKCEIKRQKGGTLFFF